MSEIVAHFASGWTIELIALEQEMDPDLTKDLLKHIWSRGLLAIGKEQSIDQLVENETIQAVQGLFITVS